MKIIPGLLLSLLLCTFGYADDPGTAAVKEVTITGSLMSDDATVLNPPNAKGATGASSERAALVIYAIAGSPEIKNEIDRVMSECWPTNDALDADQAGKLLARWTAQLKYYIAKEGPAGAELYKTKYAPQSSGYTLTGVIAEKDGRKWLTVGQAREILPQQYAAFYPKPMLTPDQPLVMPDKEPLVLQISDTLTLTCIKLPPGRYLEGSMFFMHKRFPEEYPHLVALTKAFYLSEIPITQEIYEAIMGNNPSVNKNPKLPVQNPQCADIGRFCQLLSEKTGRKIRLPTDAEWEYASRVGSSSPPLSEKYTDQYVGLAGRMVPPVKSKKPNAWGFYDMVTAWWEVVADTGFYNPRTSQIDQFFKPNCSAANHKHRGRGLWAYNHSGATVEFIPGNPELSKNTYVSQTFRIAVDAAPATTAQPAP